MQNKEIINQSFPSLKDLEARKNIGISLFVLFMSLGIFTTYASDDPKIYASVNAICMAIGVFSFGRGMQALSELENDLYYDAETSFLQPLPNSWPEGFDKFLENY